MSGSCILLLSYSNKFNLTKPLHIAVAESYQMPSHKEISSSDAHTQRTHTHNSSNKKKFISIYHNPISNFGKAIYSFLIAFRKKNTGNSVHRFRFLHAYIIHDQQDVGTYDLTRLLQINHRRNPKLKYLVY